MKPVNPKLSRIAHAFALASTLFCSAILAGHASAQDPAPVPAGEPAAPAPAPAPAAAAAAPGSPFASVTADDTAAEAQQAFNRELLTVEEDVGHLKERVFRSKSTLEMLKELIIEGAAAGARVSIWHVNQIGGAYSVEAAQYWLDGKTVFTKTEADGGLDDLTEIEVFQGNVNPGTHKIQVSLALRGKGFKVFSYLRSYQFRLQSTYDFQIDEGKSKIIRALATTRSGLRSFTDRPTIEYSEQTGLVDGGIVADIEEAKANDGQPADAAPTDAAPADDGGNGKPPKEPKTPKDGKNGGGNE